MALLGIMDRRSKLLMGLMLIVAVLLAYRAAFVSQSPSYRLSAALVAANMQPKFSEALVKQVRELQNIGERMEQVSLGEIQRALGETVRLTNLAAREFETQYASWSVLRGQIKNDGSTYEELRRQLAETQRLQEDEIRRLHLALDQASKPTLWSNLFAQGMSFLLGILSSVFATLLWDRWPRLRAWWNQGEPRFYEPVQTEQDAEITPVTSPR